MVGIKKLHFKCFSRLGSDGVPMLSAEVMGQQLTAICEKSRHVAFVKKNWPGGKDFLGLWSWLICV